MGYDGESPGKKGVVSTDVRGKISMSLVNYNIQNV